MKSVCPRSRSGNKLLHRGLIFYRRLCILDSLILCHLSFPRLLLLLYSSSRRLPISPNLINTSHRRGRAVIDFRTGTLCVCRRTNERTHPAASRHHQQTQLSLYYVCLFCGCVSCCFSIRTIIIIITLALGNHSSSWRAFIERYCDVNPLSGRLILIPRIFTEKHTPARQMQFSFTLWPSQYVSCFRE